MKAFFLKSLDYTKKNKWIFISVIFIGLIITAYFLGKSSPTEGTINLTILNDERCAECRAIEPQLTSSLKQLFPELKIKILDYKSKEGKKLYEELKVQYLPALLFNDEIKNTQNYANVQPYLVPVGDYQLLMIGASFDPTKEICDNKIDDTGNELIDCEDEDCKESLLCRTEIKNNLQVFIMSDCPYGREAIKALKEIINNFKTLNYEIHYIASETSAGFQSLHGQYEVDEDIIQLCTKKYSPEQWFNYVYCRSSKGVNGIDWKTCAKENNVDIQKVEACFNSDGKELLRQDIKIADSLGITGSPTWLANNRYTFGGISADPVKTSFCQYNQELTGCENTLSSTTAVSGSC